MVEGEGSVAAKQLDAAGSSAIVRGQCLEAVSIFRNEAGERHLFVRPYTPCIYQRYGEHERIVPQASHQQLDLLPALGW